MFPEDQLQRLKKDVKHSKRSGFAEGSVRNLKTQWTSYFIFCAYFNIQPLPVNEKTLCLYAQILSRSFTSVQSVKNYISGVKVLHELTDLPFPTCQSIEFKLTMRGLQRIKPHIVSQAEPITPDILKSLAIVLDFTNDLHVTLWAAFLVSFYCMLRVSQIVPKSNARIHQDKVLLRKDIDCSGDQILVSLRWSKTNQFQDRVLLLPLIEIPGSILCPVQALRLMCCKIQADLNDPLFVIKKGSSVYPLTYSLYQTNLRYLLSLIGKDSAKFSSHSFRRGGATWAFNCGISDHLIQLQGDWKSDAYKRYLDVSFEKKLSVYKQMVKHF